MPIIRFVIKVIAAVVNVIVNILRPIIQLVTNAILIIADLLTNLISIIENVLVALFQGIKNVLEFVLAAIDWLLTAIRDLITAILDFAGFGGGGGGGPNIFDPRTWHEGGNVAAKDLIRLPGMAPDEGIGVLQAGETVIPRGGGGGGAINMTFNIRAIDPKATSNELRRLLEELKAQRKI
jgi:hypothetical protein